MFQAIASSRTLRSLIRPAARLVDECTLHLDEDGIRIRAVDPANVGMTDLHLGEAAFESYRADGAIIGVNLSRFKNIIEMANAGQLVHLDLDEGARNMDVEFGGVHYSLALLDPDSIRDEPDIPELPLEARVTVATDEFRQAVRLADMVADHISLGVRPDEPAFVVDAEGDADDVEVVLDQEDLAAIEPADAESLFSLEYLGGMSKAATTAEEVDIELGTEFPAKLHFPIGEGHGSATYMVAPRIRS